MVEAVSGDDPNRSKRISGEPLWVQRRRYVGARISVLRDRRGLSVEQLAQLVGLRIGEMRAVESGRRGVTFECLIDIANALDVSASKLVDGMM